MSTSETGSTCKAWEETPLSNEQSLFADGSVAEAVNYCRNVGNEHDVQCFEMQPGSNLAECNVDECGEEPGFWT